MDQGDRKRTGLKPLRISLHLPTFLTVCQFALPECLIESLTKCNITLVLCALNKLSLFPLTGAQLILLLLIITLVW